MSKRITYLLGAGASQEALPLVKDIPKSLENVINQIKEYRSSYISPRTYTISKTEVTKEEVFDVLLQDMNWLYDQSINHASIDTFAKKLYITRRWKELDILRACLTVFFNILQRNKKADKRYDNFLASILQEDAFQFPDNIRVLSWNYDFQFEMAYTQYSGKDSIFESQNRLKVYTKYGKYSKVWDGFKIIKLNGTTTILSKREWRYENQFDAFESSNQTDFIDKILCDYIALRDQREELSIQSGISFAWENSNYNEINPISIAKKDTVDTDILIVIGYSFPYFNRQIDREIIQNMQKLEKVYFQAPHPFASDIKQSFMSIRQDIPSVNMVEVTSVNQFWIPPEL